MMDFAGKSDSIPRIRHSDPITVTASNNNTLGHALIVGNPNTKSYFDADRINLIEDISISVNFDTLELDVSIDNDNFEQEVENGIEEILGFNPKIGNQDNKSDSITITTRTEGYKFTIKNDVLPLVEQNELLRVEYKHYRDLLSDQLKVRITAEDQIISSIDSNQAKELLRAIEEKFAGFYKTAVKYSCILDQTWRHDLAWRVENSITSLSNATAIMFRQYKEELEDFLELEDILEVSRAAQRVIAERMAEANMTNGFLTDTNVVDLGNQQHRLSNKQPLDQPLQSTNHIGQEDGTSGDESVKERLTRLEKVTLNESANNTGAEQFDVSQNVLTVITQQTEGLLPTLCSLLVKWTSHPSRVMC